MFFESMGGRDILERVGKVFYDKIYEDPWLKNYFTEVPQEYIEKQQTDFMQAALGGDNIYAGKSPPNAHVHINVTDDVYQAREALLMEAFIECNAPQPLIDKWLKIDLAFYDRVVKKSVEDCKPRYQGEIILDFEKPT